MLHKNVHPTNSNCYELSLVGWGPSVSSEGLCSLWWWALSAVKQLGVTRAIVSDVGFLLLNRPCSFGDSQHQEPLGILGFFLEMHTCSVTLCPRIEGLRNPWKSIQIQNLMKAWVRHHWGFQNQRCPSQNLGPQTGLSPAHQWSCMKRRAWIEGPNVPGHFRFPLGSLSP